MGARAPVENDLTTLILGVVEADASRIRAALLHGADPTGLAQAMRDDAARMGGSDQALCVMIGRVKHASDALACLELLLPWCDARAKDKFGQTPLMMAVTKPEWLGKQKWLPLVTALLPVSDTLAQDKQGRSALMHALIHQNWGSAQALLPVSDTRVKNSKGQDALSMLLAFVSEPDLPMGEPWMEALIRASDLNAADSEGRVPLIHAARAGSFAAMRRLAPDTDLQAVGREGMSVAQRAREAVIQGRFGGLEERQMRDVLDAELALQEARALKESLPPGRRAPRKVAL